MKKLLIFVMMILVCFTVYSVAWSDSSSSSAKGNEKAPLPEKITYKKPAGDVPANIQNLLGKWEGKWNGELDSYFIFENVTQDSAEMVNGWGMVPGVNQVAGLERYTVLLETNSNDSTVKFSFPRVEGTVSYNGKTINAVYAGSSKIKMNKTESPDFELPEMVTKKPKVTKGLKESALLSPDNSVIEEKAPFPGYLYRPNDNAPHPGILILHGSDGGNGDYWHMPGTPPSAYVGENSFSPMLARNYAKLGYVVYALCYFDCKHHEGYDCYPPDELKDIDLLKVTYKAFLWLKNSDYVKNKKVAIWGGSRGAEQALIFASFVEKNKDNMNLTVPDAILSISPSDYVAGAFTKEQADYINNSTELDLNNFPTNNYSSWIFDGKKIKPNIPIEIENYKGPVLITYFSTDTTWGPSVHCENLAKRYSENNIPYVLIPFSKGKDVMEAVDKARNNMDKSIFINFNKEKGHHYPMDMDLRSVMNNIIDLFLKTHLGD